MSSSFSVAGPCTAYHRFFEPLPVPGPNSRQGGDPYAVASQWQNASALAKHAAATVAPPRRIVQFNFSILPSAAPVTLDVSLPPAETGGAVDVFWPDATSTAAVSLVDESQIELPVVPPIRYPMFVAASSSSSSSSSVAVSHHYHGDRCDDAHSSSSGGGGGGTSASTANANGNSNSHHSSNECDQYIQEQWIPMISTFLKSKMCALHRQVALHGIQNKRWEFEAGSYLSSLPESEWQVVVERSSVQVPIPGSSLSSAPAAMAPSQSPLISLPTVSLGAFFGSSSTSSTTQPSTGPAPPQTRTEPTKAVHLNFLLFKSRSSNVDRLKKLLSRILRHSEQQMRGGDEREQAEAMASVMMMSGDASHFIPAGQQASGCSGGIPTASQHQQQQQQEQKQANLVVDTNTSTTPSEHTGGSPTTSATTTTTTAVNSGVTSVTTTPANSMPNFSSVAPPQDPSASRPQQQQQQQHGIASAVVPDADAVADAAVHSMVMQQQQLLQEQPSATTTTTSSSSSSSSAAAAAVSDSHHHVSYGIELDASVSLTVQVSESQSNEYNVSEIQNIKVAFNVKHEMPHHHHHHHHHDAAAAHHGGVDPLRAGALQMLNQFLAEEFQHQQHIKSSIVFPDTQDFSLLDFLPHVEDAIIAIVDKTAHWCKVLYGFSVTFGPPLWDRSLIQYQSYCGTTTTTTTTASGGVGGGGQQALHDGGNPEVIITTRLPPAFCKNCVFLFETPRSDASASVITLFVHLAKGGSDDVDDAANSGGASDAPAPSVNVVSAQLDRNGQPLMFSWVPSSSNIAAEAYAGCVMQFLVDALPKLQGLYRSLLARPG